MGTEIKAYDLKDLLLSLGAVVLLNGEMVITTPNGRTIHATDVKIYTAKNGFNYLRVTDGAEYAQFKLAK